jgi:hypothetical protein
MWQADDAKLKKFQDEIMQRQMTAAGEDPKPVIEKSYKTSLEKFLDGEWLNTCEGEWEGSSYVKDKWPDQLQALMKSHIFTDDAVKRGIREWLTAELNDTISLPSTSPTKNFMTAMRLLIDGKDESLEPAHIAALKDGEKILNDLEEVRKANLVGMGRQLPSVLAQTERGRPIIKNMGEVAAGAYKRIALPAIKRFLDEKQRSGMQANLYGEYM